MKKSVKLTGSVLLSSLMFLSSCTGDKIYSSMSDDKVPSTSDKIESSTYDKLLAPTNISFDTETLTLKWDGVLGASSYDINVNGRVIKSNVAATSYKISSNIINTDKEDQFLISVRANNEDGTVRSNYTSFLYDISNTSSVSNFTFSLNEDKTSYIVNGLSPLLASLVNDEITINSEFNGLPVTEIGPNAFKGNKKISKVILPSSITKIGEYAFQGTYITEIELNSTLEEICDYAFANTIKINEYNIPASVKKIGNYAFEQTSAKKINFADNCIVESFGEGAFKNSSLSEFTLPSSVKDLGVDSFKGSKIKTFTFPSVSELTVLPEGAFSSLKNLNTKEAFKIPSYITTIANSCFESSTNLSMVYLPDDTSLKYIGDNAFKGCNKFYYFGFESAFDGASSKNIVVNVPSTIETIGANAFKDIQINSLTLNEGLKSIGANAFEGNEVITAISFPNSLLTIGANAFKDCEELAEVKFDTNSNVEYIDSTAFTKTAFINSFKNQRVVLGNVFLQASKDDLAADSIVFDSNIKGISNGAFTKSKLVNVTFPEGLKYIGDGAFKNSSKLSSLTIPSTVVEIGDEAFATCDEITSLTFVNPTNSNLLSIGVSAFEKVNKVESIILPDSVKTINESAFEGCDSLKSFDISNNSSLEVIANSSFKNCDNLTLINIPNGVKSLGSDAFAGCKALTSVSIDIENSLLETISSGTFKNTSITSINVPGTINEIESEAFLNCKDLVTINFSGKAFENSESKTIKSNTFKGCSSLVEVTLPDAITTLQADSFVDCTSLEMVHCLAKNLDKDAFRNTAFENSFENGVIVYNNILLKYAGESKDLVIPEGVIDVSANALQDSDIESVSIPSTLKSIEESAFEGCKNLKSFTCDENSSLEVIHKNAFKDCTALEEISLSKTLNTIGEYAFYGCINLKQIDLSSDFLSEVSQYAFANCNDLSNVTFGDSISVISDYAFYQTSVKNVKFGNSIKTIGNYAFANVGVAKNKLELFENWEITPTLEVIEFSSEADLDYVGMYAFANNIVKSVDLPETDNLYLDEYCFANSKELTIFKVNLGTTITQGVISGASKLATLEVPSEVSVTSMFGGYASMVPSTLKTINITEGSTSVKDNAFAGLGMVENINLPSSVTTIGDHSFYGCRSLTSINLEGIVTVGSNAFNGCSKLIDIKFSNKLEYIGDKAFFATLYLNTLDTQEFVVIDGILIQYNGNAKNVVLSDNIVAIAGGAFSGNHDIESIVLGENTKLICNGAFDSCNNLKDIEIKYDGLVNIELQTFDTLSSSLKIKVGASYLSSYKDDIYWSLYEDLLTTK